MSDTTLITTIDGKPAARGNPLFPTYTGVGLHSSAYNLPIPIFWGKRRLTPNVIWWSTLTGSVTGSAPNVAGNQTNNIGPWRGQVGFKPDSAYQSVISGEQHTVPSSGPYTFTAIHAHYSGNIYVGYYGTSITLTQVSPGSEALGKYSVNTSTGVYTFAAADAGAVVLIYYTWTNSGTVTFGSPGGSGAYWWIPAIFALCEGPVDDVFQAWDGTSPAGTYQTMLAFSDTQPAGQQGYMFFPGSSSQSAWSEWSYRNGLTPTNSFTEEALIPYRGTAYLAAWNIASGTGDAGELPQQSFECTRLPGGVGYVNANGDYLLSYIIPDLLTNSQYGMGLVSGDIDSTTLSQMMSYHIAQGLFFSPLLTSQTKCIDILDRWAIICNCWIFWDGTKLVFVPLADAVVGSFTPDLTPAYALGIGDFLDAANPVTVDRADPADCYNRLIVQVADRAFSYAPNPIEYKDQGLIDQYGVLDAASIQGDDICDAYVGAIVANLIGQRLSYIRNVYSFTLSYRYVLLLPGSIVTLTEPNIGLNAVTVRIRSIDEGDKGNLAIVAEELPGTTGTVSSTPGGYVSGGTSNAGGSSVNTNVPPGSVNTPAIIEPSSALTGTQPQVWLAASGGGNWGGALVYFSPDNVTYTQIGEVGANIAGFGGPAAQALLTANLANHADPDTTNTLSVDFTESLFVLGTVATHADADAGRTLSVIAAPPTGTDPLVMPSSWELLSYGASAQTGTYTNNLTYLRRGQYGSAPAAHSTGDDFTVLGAFTTLKWNLQSQYVGQTIYFKFLSVNTFGNAQQQLSDVPAYEYVPTGAGFGGSGAIASGSTWNFLVFQPAGTAGGNVYTTWAPLFAAAIAISGPVWIYLDPLHSSTFTVPAGTYAFTNTSVEFIGPGG